MTKIENIVLEANFIPKPNVGKGVYEMVLLYFRNNDKITPIFYYPTGLLVEPVPQFVQRKE